MFGVYFSVCLRAVIAHLVPERDKGISKILFLINIHFNIHRKSI